MHLEDYNEYYINGSDHYLIPKDAFIELFNEMQGWKDDFIGLRDVEREHQKINGKLREENKQLKEKIDKTLEILLEIKKIFKEGNFQDGCDCIIIEELIEKI